MLAIAKTQPAPGVEIIETDEPATRPGHVKIRVEKGSICGTDLHIYQWDHWAASRIHPPRIIGHEFCGTIVEVGEGVTDRKVGDFVASESHIVDPQSPDFLRGEGHVDRTTRILGVDTDGGFAPYAVIPAMNARPTSDSVPRSVASLQDALGNGVHTVMDGPVEDQTILIAGLGPIGMFAVAICRCLGAKRIVATEVSPYRMKMGLALGADLILDPREGDVLSKLKDLEPHGFDRALEMSGHSSALGLAIDAVRPAGRISMLGVYPDVLDQVDMNKVVFKGLRLQGIVGRRLWETWRQMDWLLTEKGLDVTPIVTHQLPFSDINRAFEILKAGEAGKIVLSFT